MGGNGHFSAAFQSAGPARGSVGVVSVTDGAQYRSLRGVNRTWAQFCCRCQTGSIAFSSIWPQWFRDVSNRTCLWCRTSACGLDFRVKKCFSFSTSYIKNLVLFILTQWSATVTAIPFFLLGPPQRCGFLGTEPHSFSSIWSLGLRTEAKARVCPSLTLHFMWRGCGRS